MNKHHRQQAFDTTVLLYAEGTMLEGRIPKIAVSQLDNLIILIEAGEEAIEVLDKIRRYCKANAVPGDFCVRTGEQKPLGKNGTVRGESPELTTKTPNRRLMPFQSKEKGKPVKTARKGVAVDLLKAYARRKGKAFTVNELAEIVGKEPSTVGYALNALVKDKTVTRRKAKKGEKTNANVKYVYEVAA